MALPKVIFFGTPEFAAVSLQAILNCSSWEVIAVVTQPDKPRGRGQQLAPSEVKVVASEHEIAVFQPTSLRQDSVDSELARFRTFLGQHQEIDAFLVVAYGKIIPAWLFQLPRCGTINVHGSLLPRWRGAAPIQQALLAGDEKTGVCIMQIAEGLDCGPVFAREECLIEETDNAGTLHDKLARLGAALLVRTLPSIFNGTLRAVPQAVEGITHASKWEKADCLLDFNETATVIDRRIRACAPSPGLKARMENQDVKLLRARVEILPDSQLAATVGTISEVTRESIKVVALQGLLCIEQLQFPGKRPLEVREILKGREITTAMKFSGAK